MEGFLPPVWAILWTVVALPFVAYGARRTLSTIRTDTRTKALVAVAAAFVFVLSALKLPSVAGSSSHPTGTGVLVVLFGPAITAFVSTIVLLYQSVLLAHGGLTTLGANVTSMGVVGPFVGWMAYRLVRSRLTLQQSTFVAAVVTDWATYLTTSVQLGAAFPAGEGVSGALASTLDFAAVFALTQLPIGILEGFLAAAMVGYLLRIDTISDRRLGVPS
ncbi:cobalt/nickel transport system permease protein [Haloplanus vescus]|uniref:Putative cobalt transport protein CbiM n=2 Tax=Haloplanus vescus TaxID=555874 RepID=A0A1H3YIC8_9EURY|nr:energy-coupling factor ABC transporter permease [Haloplanus vescus]SEA11287.1 cobalt/nickel transport system permease protein [Haloplanus vescus]